MSGRLRVNGPPDHEGVVELRSRIPDSLEPVLQEAARMGFLGSMPISDQIEHALGFAYCVEAERSGPPESAVDLGSGGGVPGLILALCWPACSVTLLDANERRTSFLQSAVDGLFEGDRITVVRCRAEEFSREPARRQAFEVVTARSFGSPAVTAECAAPLLSLGGLLVVSEPPDGEPRLRWPEGGLDELGLQPGSPIRFDRRFNYQTMTKSGPTPDRYPRRVGVPAKRPLF